MSTGKTTDAYADALAIISRAAPRVSRAMESDLNTLVAHAARCKALEELWPSSAVQGHEEPLALRTFRDELRFRIGSEPDGSRGIAPLLQGTDAERQFYLRTLCAVMALATHRWTVLVRAGRTGASREVEAEDAAMIVGYDSVRLRRRTYFQTRVAAAQDAFRIGAIGGSWASVLLDGAP